LQEQQATRHNRNLLKPAAQMMLGATSASRNSIPVGDRVFGVIECATNQRLAIGVEVIRRNRAERDYLPQTETRSQSAIEFSFSLYSIMRTNRSLAAPCHFCAPRMPSN
jgi:hypothetical protein